MLADPSDPEHADMRTWAGPDFDAERFDVRAARHALIMTAVWGRCAKGFAVPSCAPRWLLPTRLRVRRPHDHPAAASC